MSRSIRADKEVVSAAVANNADALQYASAELKNDPVFLQHENISYSFILKTLSALAVSAAVMTIGVLMLASVIVLPIAPVIVGATLTIAGLASTGFFAYKAIKHQLLVNACCGDNNTPEQNLGC